MRVAELFAGAGGMALGFKRAGWETAWTAELADFPSRVTKHHWHDVPQYGDVSILNGVELVARHGAIDMIAGGSPCQDLSVAGKRAGLSGARSGLFHQQMRLWDETGADLCLWENVAGALSSHNGKDFAAVLSAFVGATVAVPRDGWGGDESGGGVAAGPAGVAAWRLLDAQYFGVAQRRLRVFVLGTRAGSLDPAEVLLEPEGVYGHPPTRGETGEGTAARIGDGTPRPFHFNAYQRTVGSVASPLMGDDYKKLEVGVIQPLAFHHTQDPISGPVAPCLGATGMGTLQHVAVNISDCQAKLDDVMGTLDGRSGGSAVGSQTRGVVLAFDTAQITSKANRSRVEPGLPSPTLNGSGLVHVCATGEITHSLASEGSDASEDGTGRGTPIVAPAVAGTLKGASGLAYAGRESADDLTVINAGIPRRLTPVECEKLMGWPAGWTDVPDANGKPASDAQRYRAIGNGVVAPVAQWLAARTAHFAQEAA